MIKGGPIRQKVVKSLLEGDSSGQKLLEIFSIRQIIDHLTYECRKQAIPKCEIVQGHIRVIINYCDVTRQRL